jgi:prepilin-type N-terminal cleavage/methylation domain-containing protein/prepilin-type processing-associated H-X9-DG protein
MHTSKDHRSWGFTLIEMLTVVTIIGIIAGLLLPSLSAARERGKQIACQSNLHQLGVAIMVYAGDYQNHTPTANMNGPGLSSTGSQLPPSMWYTALTNGGYATPKVFQCPDDRRLASPGNTPRSYAMVIGYQNTASLYSSPGTGGGNFWIAGSRLTCPYLTNSQVAIVAEYYSNTLYPTIEDKGTISPFVTSSYDYNPSSTQQSGFPPLSKHGNSPLKGNCLFLDGHVEFVNSLVAGASYPNDTLANQIFPRVPTPPAGAPNPFVPCP